MKAHLNLYFIIIQVAYFGGFDLVIRLMLDLNVLDSFYVRNEL